MWRTHSLWHEALRFYAAFKSLLVTVIGSTFVGQARIAYAELVILSV